MPSPTRRQVLKGLGTIAATATFAPKVSASASEDTFILNVGDHVTTIDYSQVERAGLDVKYDQDPIGYLVVEGEESAVEDLPYDYAPDIELEIEETPQEYTPTTEELESMQEETAVEKPEAENFVEPGFYPYQWDKQYLDLDTALGHATGDGVRIAVVDSSMYLDHPDLVDNANTELSKSVVNDGEDYFHPDGNNHGTHVAGIAAASEGGNVIGMAPNAEIIGVRYFSPDVVGGAAAFGEAITYSAENADVINTSLGFPPLPKRRAILEFFEQYYGDLDAYASAQDAVWVSSAGNDATNVTEENMIIQPAGLEHNLSISATGPLGYGYALFDGDPLVAPPYSPAFYTDHGRDYVDLSAPGGNADLSMTDDLGGVPAYAWDLVFSTIFDFNDAGETVPAFGWKAGTSMAAPNTAGAAALLREQFPDAPAHQIQRLMKEHTQQVGSPVYHGNGHLSLLKPLTATDPSSERPGRNPREGGRDDRGRDDQDGGSGSGGGGGDGRGRGDDDDGDDDNEGRN